MGLVRWRRQGLPSNLIPSGQKPLISIWAESITTCQKGIPFGDISSFSQIQTRTLCLLLVRLCEDSLNRVEVAPNSIRWRTCTLSVATPSTKLALDISGLISLLSSPLRLRGLLPPTYIPPHRTPRAPDTP